MSKQPPTIDPATMDAATARMMVEADKRARADACLAEINKVLEKYKCAIDIALVLRAGQYPQPLFQIVAGE